jgi:hypothetical protein
VKAAVLPAPSIGLRPKAQSTTRSCSRDAATIRTEFGTNHGISKIQKCFGMKFLASPGARDQANVGFRQRYAV